MATPAHLQPVPTIEPHSSVTPTPQPGASTPVPTGTPSPQWTEGDIPEWLRKQMLFWQVQPTPIRARTWMLEGLDHIQANRLDLPQYLDGIKTQLGRYAIETDFPCCEEHSDRAHDVLCHITLCPGDGETMRGQFQMGNFTDYKILMFFEKRPTKVSPEKVWFRWRGRKSYGTRRTYRGDENHGWAKFRGNGEIEV
ncbi:unnamed protein product [Fusarium equiseti]|uniref:Uncharacterized protein n=1 Tax=Fusarium equiseti TaxID=61235 RepID=A0A8J2NCX1_FUSEQ|nr:unnamed protein product [Fusarium equiseti]